MTCVFGLWHESGVSAVGSVEALLGREAREYRSNQHWFQLWPGGVAIQASDAGIPIYSRQTYWENDAGALSWLDVLNGAYDSQIDSAVQAIIDAGRWSVLYPYVLVNGAEMDVNTIQQPRHPDNTSAVYPAMFAYCTARIEALGGRVRQGGPIALSWAPRAQQWLMDPADPWSAYAYAPDPATYDYVGAHAYLKWSGTTKHPAWQDRDLTQVVQRIHDFGANAGKPCAVFEAGIAKPESAAATDADRAAQITSFFSAMRQWPKGAGSFRIASWTNRAEAGGGDYLIEHMDPLSLAAFRAAVGGSFYQRLSLRAS